jgi:hypothetical protein
LLKENIFMIEWLQKWYLEQCDGEWEHEYGITIQTTDNPGWSVTIDLSFTALENLEMPYTFNEISIDEWVGYSVTKKQFVGGGDPRRLNDILAKFREIWEFRDKKRQ